MDFYFLNQTKIKESGTSTEKCKTTCDIHQTNSSCKNRTWTSAENGMPIFWRSANSGHVDQRWRSNRVQFWVSGNNTLYKFPPIIINLSIFLEIKTGPNYSILEIGKVKSEHAGNYTVKIQNVAGQSESTANILIGQKIDNLVAPNFQQILTDLKAIQGNPARFDIRISGRPQSVTWFKVSKM